MANAVQQLGSMTDPVSKLAARAGDALTPGSPEADINQAQTALTAQAAPILDRQAQAQIQASQGAQAADTQLQGNVKQLGDQMQDYSKFTPTPENKDNLFRLFALTAATTFLSGGGRSAGTGAMNNLSAAVKGYSEGRKDLFAHELTQYQQNMEMVEQHNALVRDKINEVVQLWTVDRDKAQQKLAELQAQPLSDLQKVAAKRGDLQTLLKSVEQQRTATLKHQEIMARMGMGGVGGSGDGAVDLAKIPDRIKLWAYKYLEDNKSPSVGRDPTGSIHAQVQDAAAAIAQQEWGMSLQDVAMMPAESKAIVSTLSKITQMGEGIKNAQGAMLYNLQYATELKKKLENTGTDIQWLNKQIASGRKQFGDADQNNYALALDAVSREYERAMTGPLSLGMLHVGAIEDGHKKFNEQLSLGQLEGAGQVLTTDVANVERSSQERRTALLSQLHNLPQAYGGGSVAPMSAQSTTTFNTESDADAAAAAGTLKPGTRITINGVSGVWH